MRGVFCVNEDFLLILADGVFIVVVTVYIPVFAESICVEFVFLNHCFVCLEEKMDESTSQRKS